MKKINQALLFEQMKAFVTADKPEEDEEFEAYASRFLKFYRMVYNTIGDWGYSTSLDYSKIDLEDLDFFAGEIECIPDAEIGGWEDEPDEDQIQLDRVLRVATGNELFTKSDILRMKATRQYEDYF